MLVSAIGNGLRQSPAFTSQDEQLDEVPVKKPVPRYNQTAISGGLAMAFLGTTAVTGIAHAKIPHIVSSLLAIGCALFHMETLAPHNHKKNEFIA